MAFLNKSKLAKRVAAIGVEDHPLLRETKLTESEKTAYVEGLVFAALMDDEKVDEGELEAVGRLARSLHMDDAELKNCLETVKGLKTDDEKMAFAEEIVGALKRDTIPVRFIADVESLIIKNGEIPPDAVDGLDYLGSLLFGAQDWRSERNAQQDVLEKTAKAKAAADFKTVQEALETFIAPFASKKEATADDLSKLAEFWKDETLPQGEMRVLYLWVANYSTGVMLDEMLKCWRPRTGVEGAICSAILASSLGVSDEKFQSAERTINAVVEKRLHKAWLLFALIMKKYGVEAVDTDKLSPLLRQAVAKNKISNEAYPTAFKALARDYLGEYEAGYDATAGNEAASKPVLGVRC